MLDRNTPARGLLYGCLAAIFSWWLLACILAALMLAVLR